MTFRFETDIDPAWIDYNGHLQDSYFAHIFSLAVDSVQDEVGFDATYRAKTGCTIYLLENHITYLKEVKPDAHVTVETSVLGTDQKRFHLYLVMKVGAVSHAVCEAMELHVAQKPTPKAVAMPAKALAKLQAACLEDAQIQTLSHRARSIGFKRQT